MPVTREAVMLSRPSNDVHLLMSPNYHLFACLCCSLMDDSPSSYINIDTAPVFIFPAQGFQM